MNLLIALMVVLLAAQILRPGAVDRVADFVEVHNFSRVGWLLAGWSTVVVVWAAAWS